MPASIKEWLANKAIEDSIKEVKSIKKIKPFDLNKVSKDSLISISLPAKIASIYCSYRKKINGFNKKSELSKIYGIQQTHLDLLTRYGYINIGKKKTKLVNLNICNFYQLNRILQNHKLSNRTLNFRDALGGFYDKSQYQDIYGISKEELNTLYTQTFVNPKEVKTINLRYADYKTLIEHPYIQTANAKAIYLQLKKDASFNFQDTAYIDLFEESFINKISPYFVNIDSLLN